MSQLHIHQPDHRIDRVLTALRDTPAPTGLEARIAHRLLQAQTTPTHPATTTSLTGKLFALRPFFAVILEPQAKDPRIVLTAATALAFALAIPLSRLHHEQPAVATQATTSTAPTPKAVILNGVSRGLVRETQSKDFTTARISTTAQSLPAPNDPDTIALAETLAPSHPIPPQPLTAEEHLLFTATRPGQPIELAQLDQAREPVLRAAAVAREHTSFVQIARSLLAPLAAAEALDPTTDTITQSPR